LKTRILIVCQWPLGGIRTYMKYVYRHFPADEFEMTLLASPSVVKEHVTRDMEGLPVTVKWAPYFHGRKVLFWHVFKELRTNKYDLIHAQGFISAFHAAAANWFFKVPHVLTIHGIIEQGYLEGWLAPIKRFIFRGAMKNVTVFHGVGKDILEHFRERFPSLDHPRSRWITITNGISTQRFGRTKDNPGAYLRSECGIADDVFIFGFFGRFIPQKGFNYIIDAVDKLAKEGKPARDFLILSFGGTDMVNEYRAEVGRRGLDKYFQFEGFRSDISDVMMGCDAVPMPSIWEAWPLLAAEVFCCGVPLIASDCIGLREASEDTPALKIPTHDVDALAGAMAAVMSDDKYKAEAQAFRTEAVKRFDVGRTAEQMLRLFREITAR